MGMALGVGRCESQEAEPARRTRAGGVKQHSGEVRETLSGWDGVAPGGFDCGLTTADVSLIGHALSVVKRLGREQLADARASGAARSQAVGKAYCSGQLGAGA